MVAVTAVDLAQPPTDAPRRRIVRMRGTTRRIVLLIAGLYFIGPIAAATWYSIDSGSGASLRAYTRIPTAPGFGSAVLMSFEVAALTVVISLVLMIPTMLIVQLRVPRARTAVELLSLMPLVVPPVVLVVGVSKLIAWGNTTDTTTFRFQLVNQLLNSHPPIVLPLLYTILALPFTYRALDSGLRSAPIATLVEAAQNLGAGWVTILVRVLLPALRTAVLNAAFLIFALAFGEFTVASILQIQTFTVWLLQFNNTDGQLSVALSVLSLLLTWFLLLVMATVGGRAPETRTGRGRR